MTEQTNNCTGYDLTIYETVKGKTYTYLDMGDMLKQVASKFVFQLEEGEEKKRHFQIRMHAMKKTRASPLLKLVFKCLNITDAKAFIFCKPTSKDVHNKKNFNYVMKAEGRIAGPWTDEFFKEHINYNIIDEFIDFKEENLRPFQKSIVDIINTKDLRKIDIIFDPDGNRGKGFIADYLEIFCDCYILPNIDDYKLIMQDAQNAVMRRIKRLGIANKNIKGFILDMPRAMEFREMKKLIYAIESIKGGRLQDYRNHSTEPIRINKPRVILFTNEPIDMTLYSKDRYAVWTIDDKDALIPFTFPKVEKAYYEYEPAKPTTRIIYDNAGTATKVCKKRDEDDDPPPVIPKKLIKNKKLVYLE